MMNNSQLQIFFSLMVFVFGLIALGFWLIKSWEIRRNIRGIAKTNSESEQQESLIYRMLDKAAGLFSTDTDETSKKMIEGGFYGATWANLFMPLKYALFLGGELVVFVLYHLNALSSTIALLIGALWLVLTVSAPDMYLASRKKAVNRKLSTQLPYLLDLMAVCVQTGMTIEAAIKYLCVEIKGFDKHLAYMLNKVNDRAQIVGLEQALDELQKQIPSSEIASFAITLNQSLRYGSSVYSMLTTLAADIREVQMLSLEERIGKLAAKMSIPLIIFIMIPLVILIAAPGVMRVLVNV